VKGYVNTPPGALVPFNAFCRAIAEAIFPVEQIEGIDCIVGMSSVDYVSFKVADFWDSGPFNKLKRKDHVFLMSERGPLVKWEMPTLALKAKEIEEIKKLLSALPPLKYPVSEKLKAEFLTAYSDLHGCSAACPVLITEEHVEVQRADNAREFVRRQGLIQEELDAGRLIAVDARHHPVVVLDATTFIPRKYAIAYLERCGLALHSNGEISGDHGDVASQESNADGQVSVSKQSGHKLTPKQRNEELVAYRMKLEKEGNVECPTKLTAEKYGVSDSYVRRLVAKKRKLQSSALKTRTIRQKR